jgi:hypothetical protein
MPLASVSKKRSSSVLSVSMIRFSSALSLGYASPISFTRSGTSLWKNGFFWPSL